MLNTGPENTNEINKEITMNTVKNFLHIMLEGWIEARRNYINHKQQKYNLVK